MNPLRTLKPSFWELNRFPDYKKDVFRKYIYYKNTLCPLTFSHPHSPPRSNYVLTNASPQGMFALTTYLTLKNRDCEYPLNRSPSHSCSKINVLIVTINWNKSRVFYSLFKHRFCSISPHFFFMLMVGCIFLWPELFSSCVSQLLWIV